MYKIFLSCNNKGNALTRKEKLQWQRIKIIIIGRTPQIKVPAALVPAISPKPPQKATIQQHRNPVAIIWNKNFEH
jgi:hypothetical protein